MRLYAQWSRPETSSARSERAIAREPKYEVGSVLECHSDNQVRTSSQAETQPRLQLDKKRHIPEARQKARER